jgi:hypothetical protein
MTFHSPKLPRSASRNPAVPAGIAAFTLPEIMTVSAIFSLLILAFVACQMFGLKSYRIAETKMGATAGARKALNQIRERIREGKIVVIGKGTSSTFTNVPDNLPQIGNALQVYATTNLASYQRFYLDTNDNCLKSVSSLAPTPLIVARYITNQFIFQAEDFRGQVLTNDDNNRVIRMTLDFYKWEFPIAGTGQGSMYDYYRLQTRVTRRMIE